MNPRQIKPYGAYCSSPLESYFLEKPPRGGKRQRSLLSAIINKRIRHGVIEKKPKRDRKPQQKSELDRRLCSICTKLDKGNVNAGIRKAVGEDKILVFTVDNYDALKLKHPQMETCSAPDPTDINCFSTSKVFVHKALISFPNGSSARLDGISPQILKDLTAKLNGQTGPNFLRALTSLVIVILEGNVPFELRPYFFGAKLIDCLIENPQPKENVILKIDFENAYNSINRQIMLEKVFEIHPEVYKNSHSAYSQPTFLFFTVIQ